MLPLHSELVGLLPDALNGPLPGIAAHRTMAPYPARIRLETISVEGKDAREAATLVLLFPYQGGDESALVLTVRQPELRDHSGQISFPGGSRDGSETAEETALREGWEEVGVPAEHPTVLGRLSPIYIPPSEFSVFPVLAALYYLPPFQLQEAQVVEFLVLSIRQLLDPATRHTPNRKIRGRILESSLFPVDGHEVWGATAMMLAEFVAVLRSIA